MLKVRKEKRSLLWDIIRLRYLLGIQVDTKSVRIVSDVSVYKSFTRR